MNTEEPKIIITASFVSVTFAGERSPKMVSSANEKDYLEVVELCRNKNWEELYKKLYPETFIDKISGGELEIRDGICFYEDQPVHNVVVSKIQECIDEELPYDNLLNFLKNTLECDSFDVLNELYLFLTSNESMPINVDGSFLAYRVVDHEYKSKHPNPDGSYNTNKVGEIVTQRRNRVNPNRSETCAEGLHFCSFNYISTYGYSGRDRVMLVKIFPQDVVAIPNDYNNAKGRCCKYEVIAEVENYVSGQTFEQHAKAKINAERIDNPLFDTPHDSVEYDDAEKYKVEGVLDRQLNKSDSTITLRRAANCTSNPYVNVSKFLKISVDLGFKIELNDVLSKSIISRSK
jgi:hypothetical protein